MSLDRRVEDPISKQLLKIELSLQALNTGIEHIVSSIEIEQKWREQHISESVTSTHSRVNDKIASLEKVCLNLTWKIFIVGLGGGALSGGIQRLLEFLK